MIDHNPPLLPDVIVSTDSADARTNAAIDFAVGTREIEEAVRADRISREPSGFAHLSGKDARSALATLRRQGLTACRALIGA